MSEACRPWRAALCGGALLVLGALDLLPVAAIGDGPADDVMRVEFVNPASWHCTDSAGCLTCRNLAAEPTDVLMWPTGSVTPERRRVPPGAGLLVCRPLDHTAAAERDFARRRCML